MIKTDLQRILVKKHNNDNTYIKMNNPIRPFMEDNTEGDVGR